MASPDMLRYTRIPLTHGAGAIPPVGFGTLIPDPLATRWTRSGRSWPQRGSSLPWCKSNPTRTFPSGSCSSSARSRGSYSWHSQPWATV